MTYCIDTLLANIAEGYEITFAAGKDGDSTTNLLRGIIESVEIKEGGPNFMSITLSGPDFGSAILKHTVVNGAWIQRKAANGVDLDMTDTTTLLYNIIDDMISNPNQYPIPTDNITAETKGINAVSASFCRPPNVTIPQFYSNCEFIDDKLSEIDEEWNLIHYVDYDKNLVVESPTLSASGILLVDDHTDSVAQSWDTTKLGLLQTTSYEKTLETHRKRLFGYGGDQRLEHDQQRQLTVTDSTVNHTNWLAMKFMPYYTNIESIGVYVDKVGDPPNLQVLFIANDSDGKPLSSTIRKLSIDAEKISTSPGWHYVQVNENPINNTASYWIVLQATGDTNNYYRWYRTDGSTSFTTATSTDGLSWTVDSSSDGFAYRVVSTSPLVVILPTVGVSASDKHFYEETVKKPDVTQVERMQNILRGIGSTAFKRKHILKARVKAPDTLLRANQTVRIRKQKAGHKFDDTFVIGDITYRFDTSRGYLSQDIEAVRYSNYP